MGITSKRARWWILGGGIGIVVVVAGVMLGSGSASRDWGNPATGAGLAGSGEAAPGDEAEAVAVTVAPVKHEAIQRTVQVVGSFQGYDEVTVTAEVQGRVAAIHHDVGDVVRPGDVLLEIDPTDYELALQEARRAFEADLTKLASSDKEQKELADKLNRLRAADLPQNLFDIESLPMVKRAREQEKNARNVYERAKELREKQVLSQELFEQAETAYEVARNTRLQTVMDAQAILASARLRAAVLATAEQKLKYTRVVVPESTVAARSGLKREQIEYSVARRRVDEGEMVKDSMNATAAVFDLVIDKLLKFQGTVPERYVGLVKKDQKVELRVEAYPDKVFQGTVARIHPTVDRASRTFQVEVLVPNESRELKPGGFAKADILTHVDRKALVVPAEALKSFAGVFKVFVVRDGKAEAAVVTPGVAGSGWVELAKFDSSQIAPGALVVTSGAERLAHGSRVQVRQP